MEPLLITLFNPYKNNQNPLHLSFKIFKTKHQKQKNHEKIKTLSKYLNTTHQNYKT